MKKKGRQKKRKKPEKGKGEKMKEKVLNEERNYEQWLR